MSVATSMKPTSTPFSFRVGCTSVSTQQSRPSLARLSTSTRHAVPAAAASSSVLIVAGSALWLRSSSPGGRPCASASASPLRCVKPSLIQVRCSAASVTRTAFEVCRTARATRSRSRSRSRSSIMRCARVCARTLAAARGPRPAATRPAHQAAGQRAADGAGGEAGAIDRGVEDRRRADAQRQSTPTYSDAAR